MRSRLGSWPRRYVAYVVPGPDDCQCPNKLRLRIRPGKTSWSVFAQTRFMHVSSRLQKANSMVSVSDLKTLRSWERPTQLGVMPQTGYRSHVYAKYGESRNRVDTNRTDDAGEIIFSLSASVRHDSIASSRCQRQDSQDGQSDIQIFPQCSRRWSSARYRRKDVGSAPTLR